MNNQNKSSTQNLLDVDLDAIVEEGKKQSKRNSKILIISAVILVIAGICGFIAYQHNQAAKREALYQEAITAQEAADYETAIALFQELGEYKDSQNLLEETEFAYDFVTSDIYTAFLDAIEENFYQTGLSSGGTKYDVKTRTVTISTTMSEDVEEGFNFSEISPVLLSSWVATCDALNYLTETVYAGFSDDGYPVDCTLNLANGNAETLYSTTNGETTYNCVDIENCTADAYEELYAQMVNLVDDGRYQEAYDYWNSNNIDSYFNLDYKDLKDYYYYSAALRGYDESKPLLINQYLSGLNKISPSFKNVAQLTDTLEMVTASLNGTYILQEGTIKHRIVIKHDYVEIKDFSRNSTTAFWTYANASQKIAWFMEDGKPSYAEVDCGAWIFSLTPTENGLNVKVAANGKPETNKSGIWEYPKICVTAQSSGNRAKI